MFAQSLKSRPSIIILLAILVGSASARHFNPLDSITGATLTVFLDTAAAHPTLNGTPIRNNNIVPDEIGVFDSVGNCWGVGYWPAGADSIISVAGYNNTGVIHLGMKAGATMHFKLWDTTLGEMPAAVTYYPTTAPVPFPPGMTPSTESTFVAGSPIAYSVPMSLTGLPSPGVPGLSFPTNGSTNQNPVLTLNWTTSSFASSYAIQVSTTSTFSNTTTMQSGLTGVSASLGGLASYTIYYWKVNATNPGSTGTWSGTWSFTTIERLSIPIINGWFMYSLNLQPADSSTNGVFGKLKGFVMAMDGSGNLCWPRASLDEIGTVHTGSGYWILDTLSNDTLKLTGPADPIASNPIPLKVGIWNLVSYLPQESMAVGTALNSIYSQIVLAVDGNGDLYWPAASLDEIGTMTVGNGYYIVTNATTSLTYPIAGSNPAKIAATFGKPLINPPAPKHFAKHANTGNFTACLAKLADVGSTAATGSCEIGAFDSKGNLVGAGTVIDGQSAFAIWGKNPVSTALYGCEASEKISFKLWNSCTEIPLRVSGGTDPVFASKTIIKVTLAFPGQEIQSSFSAPRACPNPFRHSVRIAFDVPALPGATDLLVAIGIYDIRGNLVQLLARGRYSAGSYSVSWNGRSSGNNDQGSGIYFARMTANGVEKQAKLIELK